MCGCTSLPASEASVTNSFRASLPRSPSEKTLLATTLMATSRAAKGSCAM
jgi:hypothetical protein